jgi:hypothetical protein
LVGRRKVNVFLGEFPKTRLWRLSGNTRPYALALILQVAHL